MSPDLRPGMSGACRQKRHRRRLFDFVRGDSGAASRLRARLGCKKRQSSATRVGNLTEEGPVLLLAHLGEEAGRREFTGLE